MFPLADDGDALLWTLLGPTKSAAVRERAKKLGKGSTTHVQDLALPAPKVVKPDSRELLEKGAASPVQITPPGMPMQFPYGAGQPVHQNTPVAPPQPIPSVAGTPPMKIPGVPQLGTSIKPDPLPKPASSVSSAATPKMANLLLTAPGDAAAGALGAGTPQSWFARNQDLAMPVGLGAAGLLGGGLLAGQLAPKKKRYRPDGTEILDEEKASSVPIATPRTFNVEPGYDKPPTGNWGPDSGGGNGKPFAAEKILKIDLRNGQTLGTADLSPATSKRTLGDAGRRDHTIHDKDYAQPEGFVDRNWPYLLGGAGLAGLGYAGYQYLNADKNKKRADALLGAVEQGGRDVGEWGRRNPERADNVAATAMTGALAGVPAAMALRGGFSLARSPRDYALQSAARGAGIGAGAAIGSTLAGAGHAVLGEPTDLATRLLLQGAGGVLGGVGMSRLLGPHPQEKDEAKAKAKAEALAAAGTKQAALPEFSVGDTSTWKLGDRLNQDVVDPLAQGVVDPIARRTGQQFIQGATGGVSTPGTMLGKGVNDFLDDNRWANMAAWGAPIGAGIGLLGGMVNGKKKRNMLGDALTGGLLGAGAGGLIGGAAGMYSTPDRPPTPAEPEAQAPLVNTPGLPGAPPQGPVDATKNKLLDVDANFRATPDQARAQQQLKDTVGTVNAAAPFVTPKGREALAPVGEYADAYGQGIKELGGRDPLGRGTQLQRWGNDALSLGQVPAVPQQRVDELQGAVRDKLPAAQQALTNLTPAYRPDETDPMTPYKAIPGQISNANDLADQRRFTQDMPLGNLGTGVRDLMNQKSDTAFDAMTAAGKAPGLPGSPESPEALPDGSLASGVGGRRALESSALIGAARGGAKGVGSALGAQGLVSPESSGGKLQNFQKALNGEPTGWGNKLTRNTLGLLGNGPSTPVTGSALAADPGAVNRLFTELNKNNTTTVITPDQIRQSLSRVGTSKDQTPLDARVREAIGNVQGPMGAPSMAGKDLAMNPQMTRTLSTAASVTEADAAQFLATGNATTPAATAQLRRVAGSNDGPIGPMQVTKNRFGTGTSVTLGEPKSLSTRVGSGVRSLATGVASPVNPKNLLLGALASAGSYGSGLVAPEKTVPPLTRAVETLQQRLERLRSGQ